MKRGSTGTFAAGTFALLGVSLSAVCLVGCTPEPRPLPEVPEGPSGSAGPGATEPAATWSYQGDRGPNNWGTLRGDWAACAGPGQSPIDLPLDAIGTAAAAPELAVTLDLPPTPLTLRTSEQAVALTGTNAFGLTVDGQRSPIQTVELHVPAEHRLGGTSFDAELVFRAEGPGGRPILLSLLYRVGAAHVAWAGLLQTLPKAGAPGDKPLPGPIDLGQFVPSAAPLLAYEGSLSAPPCTTGALRLVVAQVGEMSSDQLMALRQAVPQSARPIQDRGERSVTLRSLTGPSSAMSPPAPSPGAKAPAPNPTEKKTP